MRIVTLLIASLMVLGTLVCNSAWALPGDATEQVHATPLHSHATPGHAHDEGHSVADPCELTSTINAPSLTVATPQPGPPVAIGVGPDSITASLALLVPPPPLVARVLPAPPVLQHVVLLI